MANQDRTGGGGGGSFSEGSDIGFDEICDKALSGWYLSAEETLERGLVAGII